MIVVFRTLLAVTPVLSLLVHNQNPLTCKVGWVQYKNKCYMFSVVKENWYNSEIFCRAMDGHLAEIHSSDVNDFLKTHLKVKHFDDHSVFYWIGLTDVAQANKWIWEHSGDTPAFTDWGPGQPENNDQHCGILLGPSAFKWHDTSCNDNTFFVCQSNLMAK